MRNPVDVARTELSAYRSRRSLRQREKNASELAAGVDVVFTDADLRKLSSASGRLLPGGCARRAFFVCAVAFFLCSALSVLNLNPGEVLAFAVVGSVFFGLSKLAELSDRAESPVRDEICAYMMRNGFVELATVKRPLPSGGTEDVTVVQDSPAFSVRSVKFDGAPALQIEISFGFGPWRERALKAGPSLSAWFEFPVLDSRPGLSSVVYVLAKPPERLDFDVSKSRLGSWRKIPLAAGLTWDLARQPHLILSGGTGGGKSFGLLCLVAYLLRLGYDGDPRQTSLYVCDPKNAELAQLASVLPDGHVAVTAHQVAGVLRKVVSEMNDRYAAMKAAGHVGGTFEDAGLVPLVVLLDEFGALKASADKKTFGEIMDKLTQIILKGRAAGVFVVLATQQPRAEVIPTDLRDQFSLRMSLGGLSCEGYRMTYGEAASGFEFRSLTEPGTGYLLMPGFSSPREFGAWRVAPGTNLVDVIASLVAPSGAEDAAETDADKA